MNIIMFVLIVILFISVVILFKRIRVLMNMIHNLYEIQDTTTDTIRIINETLSSVFIKIKDVNKEVKNGWK